MPRTTQYRTVVAVFQDVASAETAVGALRQARFLDDEIGLEEGGEESRGLLGALTGMGVPETEAGAYEDTRRAGRALVTVRTFERRAEAQGILRRASAIAADEPPATQTAAPRPPVTGGAQAQAISDGVRTVELLEEELVVQTRLIEDTQVVIRKDVKVVTRTIEVSLTREELVVERRAVERTAVLPGTEVPTAEIENSFLTRFRELQPGQVIRVPLAEEEPVIEKRPVVYEEVLLGEKVVTETRRLSADVRREELQMERKVQSDLPPGHTLS